MQESLLRQTLCVTSDNTKESVLWLAQMTYVLTLCKFPPFERQGHFRWSDKQIVDTSIQIMLQKAPFLKSNV